MRKGRISWRGQLTVCGTTSILRDLRKSTKGSKSTKQGHGRVCLNTVSQDCLQLQTPSWVPEAQWLHCLGATCNQETVLLFPYVDLSVLIKRRRGNPWSHLLPSCLWTGISRTEYFVTLLLALIESEGSWGSLTLACCSLRGMAFCASMEGQWGIGIIQ